MSGYSPRTLVEKLGIKSNMKGVIINPPRGYVENILGKLPENVDFGNTLCPELDFIHIFTTEKSDLLKSFPQIRNSLTKNGTVWVSWPKKSSKVVTDLDENVVRDMGLKNGMVDVKVCAIDNHWSGLKFVLFLKDR